MSDKIEVRVNDILVWAQAATGAPVPVPTPVPTPTPTPVPTPVPTPTLVGNCQIIDARGWLPGNISTDNRIMHGQAGVIVSYLFSVAQLRDRNLNKQGKIEFNETPPGVQFEISNTPCDMTMPIPVPGNTASWLVPARGGKLDGNRYPRLNYTCPGTPTLEAYAWAAIGTPDSAGNYYVNVKPAANGDYFLWYW